MTIADDLLWNRWDEVDQLLDQLLDLPADERLTHLAIAAGADRALHDLVLRLLGRVNGDARRVAGPSSAVVRGAFPDEDEGELGSDLAPGTAVGRFVVTGRRGRGGMATVYAARRSDGVYEQEVALKVLRRGLDTEDLVRRFVNERQILSSLRHPNIAKLLDGGALPDGRPYLVMELVDGVPITERADTAQLGVTDRLDLFLEVASAVHAAHQQLVVHRDIKPSNILVDDARRVKLLDFGIAKLIEGDSGHTATGARMLTPDYASPEQIRGGPITTGTDVYQLGLLLRELLTGLPPLAGDTNPGEPPIHPSRAATLAVADTPAPEQRASRRGTTPSRLARALDGDLDIIVGKAVRPEPNERYASAEEMAADVRRHLKGLPILAHPESARYRMRKLAARHPYLFPGAAAALLIVVGFTVALSFQNRRIGHERDAAEAATRRAVATQDFLVDLLRSPDPRSSAGEGSAQDLTVVDALQRGRQRVGTELSGQPEVQAALWEAMGRTFTGLGRHEAADTLLRQALATRRQLSGASATDIALVLAALADNSRRERNHAVADSILHEELRVRSAAGPVADTTLARILSALSATRRDLGDVDSALTLASRAVALLGPARDTTDQQLTDALGALAYALRGANRLDSAEVVYRRVLARQQRAPNPDRYGLAITHNNIGYLLRTRGDFAAAEQSYRAASRLAEATLGEGHPTTIMFTGNLAGALEGQGKIEEVLSIVSRRVEAARRQWPDGSWHIGEAQLAMGRFLDRHGRTDEAIPPLRAGVANYASSLGTRHAWTAIAESDLAVALARAGRSDESERLLDRAYASLRALPDGPDFQLRSLIDRLVQTLRSVGNDGQADRFTSLTVAASP